MEIKYLSQVVNICLTELQLGMATLGSKNGHRIRQRKNNRWCFS